MLPERLELLEHERNIKFVIAAKLYMKSMLDDDLLYQRAEYDRVNEELVMLDSEIKLVKEMLSESSR